MSFATLLRGIVSRGQPQPTSDKVEDSVRLGRYQEIFAIPLIRGMQALADEGSYYTTTNPTPGTPIAYVVQASFSDTVAAITFRNSDSKSAADGGKRVYPHFIRLIAGATVPASATSGHYALKTDNSARASVGTTLTPQNVNLDYGNTSVADIRWTPSVAAATVNARLLSRGVLRSVIPVAN